MARVLGWGKEWGWGDKGPCEIITGRQEWSGFFLVLILERVHTCGRHGMR